MYVLVVLRSKNKDNGITLYKTIIQILLIISNFSNLISKLVEIMKSVFQKYFIKFL